MKRVNIAIDGPSGAGKSSLAKNIAKHFGYIYVDTGALYRGIGYFMISEGIDPADTDRVKDKLREIELSFRHIDGVQHVFVNGCDVTDKIRTKEVSMAASTVSAIPEVRNFLLDCQRNIASEYDIVMDGRDVGTVILPDADVKIFLTASVKVRAERRFRELTEKGESVSFEEVYADIEKRDYNDTHRAAAPLKQAEGAYLADTSDLTLEDSVALVIKIITEGTKKS